ncbi:NrdH-redoxin [archaeon]|jgi:glutaredoxin 3|nr:NrdH-redoxin [archaeon]
MAVTIYSTPTCPWCKRTKEFLKENKIKFKDFDVSSNKKAAEEMQKKSNQMGVPVMDIDGEIIIGFDESKIKKALKIK